MRHAVRGEIRAIATGVSHLGGKRSKLERKTNTETEMPPADDELKARLMSEAESAIDRMLVKRKTKERITLSDIEHLALELRREVGEKATQVLVETVEEQAIPGPECPTCGKEMHYKGRKTRRVATQSGEVTFQRAYYYCETCQQGFFPPG